MKRKYFSYIVFFFIISLIFVSCSHQRIVTDKLNNKKIYNLSYGENKRQIVDVFMAEKKQDSTFVLLIHGGGWRWGSKSHLRNVQNFLLKNGISSASMNYRFADKNTNYTHQLKDIESSIHFLDSIKCENCDLVLLGESAGAHLALLYSYRNPDEVEKVISFAAPTDFYSENLTDLKFYHWYTKSAFSRAVGEKYKRKEPIPQSFVEASPISQVANVPTLLFQGSWDVIVNKNQATTLDSILTEKEIPHELVIIKGANHTPRLMPWWRNKVIYPKVLEFIKE